MIVFVEDSFVSAHWLPNVPDDHKCKKLHGHTYRIRIEFEGKVDKQTGWVVDYSEIKEKWSAVKTILDRTCLNEIKGLENSTCENLADWIWERLDGFKHRYPYLKRIELRETANCGVVKE